MTGLSRGRFWNTLLVLAILILAVPASAATWRVEQDGSGDFTTIQAAVDAAADGDVIAIGPGHYSDSMTYHGTYGEWEICVLLDGSKSLSFVGAGSGLTTVGPEGPQVEDDTIAFGLLSTSEAYTVTFDGLAIVNAHSGVDASGSTVQVTNCHFDNCYEGLYIGTHSSGALTVTDCTFQGTSFIGVPTAILSGAQWTAIERVEITDWGTGIQLFNNVGADALIADCLIDGGDIGRVGIYITDGPSATVRDCEVRNLHNGGLGVGGAGTVTCHDNLFDNCGYTGVDLGGCASFTMVDNIIQSSESCFYIAIPCDVQSIHGNHFLRDVANDGYYVKTPDIFPWGPFYEDFTMNYWGTTDVDEISQWIIDGYDDPDDPDGIYIVFEPMADSPVATETRSWSAVKELFRRE
jgi:pectinesterase